MTVQNLLNINSLSIILNKGVHNTLVTHQVNVKILNSCNYVDFTLVYLLCFERRCAEYSTCDVVEYTCFTELAEIYIQKLKNKNSSMLYFEVWENEPITTHRNHRGSNSFDEDEPGNLIDPTGCLDSPYFNCYR
jgi:hypothetical protein